MRTLLIVSLILLSTLSFSKENWQLAQEKDGINIYTQPNTKTKLNDFKADMIVQATLNDVNSQLSALESHTKWMFDRKLTKVLARPDNRTSIVYSITDAPWPVTKRDAVVRFTYDASNTTEFIRIDFASLDDYYPINDDMVRVPYIKGFWELVKIDDNSTKITFMNAASPGGSLPGWLADSFVLDMPYHSLKNLRNRLKNQE